MRRGCPGFWALSGQSVCLELVLLVSKHSGSIPGHDLRVARVVVFGGGHLSARFPGLSRGKVGCKALVGGWAVFSETLPQDMERVSGMKPLELWGGMQSL